MNCFSGQLICDLARFRLRVKKTTISITATAARTAATVVMASFCCGDFCGLLDVAVVGAGELLGVGIWLGCGVSLAAGEMLKGERSGYLSSTVKFAVSGLVVTL